MSCRSVGGRTLARHVRSEGSTPSDSTLGLVVQRKYIGLSRRRRGFNSLRGHAHPRECSVVAFAGDAPVEERLPRKQETGSSTLPTSSVPS
jgi:hypothetical protein